MIGRRRRSRRMRFMLGSVAGSLGRRRRRRHAGLGASKKSCTKANGRLKKGWRWGKGGRCVRAKK